MKKLVFIFILLLFGSCSKRYNGYIYDFETEIPIQNVKVFYTDTTFVVSNEKGYFELKEKSKIKYLMFKKENYQTLNLPTLNRQNNFVREIPIGDTIYLISKFSKYNRPKIGLPKKK